MSGLNVKFTVRGNTKTLSLWLSDLKMTPAEFWRLRKLMGREAVSKVLERLLSK